MGERNLSNQIRRISQLVDGLSQVDRYCRVESWLFFPDMFDPFLVIMAYNVVVFCCPGVISTVALAIFPGEFPRKSTRSLA